MSDSDLISLYSGRILELAANVPLTGRLSAPDASARRRSPVCGSSITVDLVLKDGRVSEYAQEVRACALGQASAAILGQMVIGRSPAELTALRDAVADMLRSGGDGPDAPFDLYRVLIPAREFRNRHASILLALEAAAEAAEIAGSKDP
ncbi:iron-sulfur cluster assembly scaffold protein [Xinfangfangia sp. D13-10-4-6]|uniref:iron-sulfur cluster assembly scaffold protein n=1 Tax=Pseudogemmobacter hezensis TaxID=2737662 RepID=UPI00155255DE|nr:iron-sulfur cluster assembly scaffold protein [Pseudogemmobacter hezensis]NPD15894.1 iron-sulfur cluster assembly scaffold protein [Pseudogemmobacter hezensis]